VAFRGLDDDFDTDFGYSGRVQFGLIVRDKDISDAAGDSNGFESDNFSTGLGRTPITKAVFSNITSIGPKRDGSTALPAGEKFERAIFTRRNTALSVHNSIIIGWEKGWHVSGSITFDNYDATTSLDSMGVVRSTIIANNVFPHFVYDAGGATAAWYNTYAGSHAIDTVSTPTQIAFVNAFPTNLEDNSDFRLSASSVAASGADFSGPQFTGGFVGIQEAKANETAFVIFPNPAGYQTTLAFTTNEKATVSVEVYDVLGHLVSVASQNNSFEKGYNTISLNTADLSNGIYYIALDVNGVKETKKLVINK
jgi:hypothetical protein